MARASLIVSNHADDVEILARVHLVVCLRLCRLMNDALANISKQLSRHRVGDGTVAGRLLETNCIIQAREIARTRAHLELFEVERFDLANKIVLVLEAVGRSYQSYWRQRRCCCGLVLGLVSSFDGQHNKTSTLNDKKKLFRLKSYFTSMGTGATNVCDPYVEQAGPIANCNDVQRYGAQVARV